MNFCSQLPNFEIISEVSKFSELEYNDIDYNLPNQVSNKFYSMGDLQKLKISKNFNILTYFNIEGYDNHFTASFSERGVAIYTRDKLSSFEHTDLKIQNIDFESVWIEIKNNNSRNIICGCLYRHPRYDLSEFLQYLEKSMVTLILIY